MPRPIAFIFAYKNGITCAFILLLECILVCLNDKKIYKLEIRTGPMQ